MLKLPRIMVSIERKVQIDKTDKSYHRQQAKKDFRCDEITNRLIVVFFAFDRIYIFQTVNKCSGMHLTRRFVQFQPNILDTFYFGRKFNMPTMPLFGNRFHWAYFGKFRLSLNSHNRN